MINGRTGRYILMKLYNNLLHETGSTDRPVGRRESTSRGNAGDARYDGTREVLRFDMMEDEFEDHDDAFGDPPDSEADFENVDVQAILFYGHTGRRRFPSIKPL
jgi:hypothetical protein